MQWLQPQRTDRKKQNDFLKIGFNDFDKILLECSLLGIARQVSKMGSKVCSWVIDKQNKKKQQQIRHGVVIK